VLYYLIVCTAPGPCLLADKKSNTRVSHTTRSTAFVWFLVYVNFGSANLDPPTNMATSCIYIVERELNLSRNTLEVTEHGGSLKSRRLLLVFTIGAFGNERAACVDAQLSFYKILMAHRMKQTSLRSFRVLSIISLSS
jgi:hypothetical protein